MNDVTTEYCSEHVEIRWLGDQTAPPFSTWSVGQLKDFLLNENIDFSTMREKSELIGACKSTLPYANNGELARYCPIEGLLLCQLSYKNNECSYNCLIRSERESLHTFSCAVLCYKVHVLS